MGGERRDHTLQATALVHEALIRLHQREALTEADRARWLAAAAEEMRRVLVDHARARNALKRGRGKRAIDVDVADLGQLINEESGETAVALDAALSRLEEVDARAADVVRLRFFLRMSVDETAAGLGVSRRSVLRDWQFARAFLLSELTSPGAKPGAAAQDGASPRT
jgi:RNA polymerase sigma factor (TIGR02999 family)